MGCCGLCCCCQHSKKKRRCCCKGNLIRKALAPEQCPGNSIFLTRLFSSAGVILSVLTISGCRFVSHRCLDANLNPTHGCQPPRANATYFGLLYYDVSTIYHAAAAQHNFTFEDTSTQALTGSCIPYWERRGDGVDPYFQAARILAMVAFVVGVFAALMSYATDACCRRSTILLVLGNGLSNALASTCQGLTLLLWKSDFCTGVGMTGLLGQKVEWQSKCEFDQTAWISISATSCYFVSFALSILSAPFLAWIDRKNAMEEDEDVDDGSVYIDETGAGVTPQRLPDSEFKDCFESERQIPQDWSSSEEETWEMKKANGIEQRI